MALLEAAATAASTQFPPLAEPIGIEVVITTPSGKARADATNYLGGIGDVLQARAKRAQVAYGELARVALFTDDGLIREVRYRESAGDSETYSVRIWPLHMETGGPS